MVARDQADDTQDLEQLKSTHQSMGIRPSDCDSRWRAQGSAWQLVGMD